MKKKFLTSLAIVLGIGILSTGVYANYYDDILEGTWAMPNESDIPDNAQGDMVRYGKELFVNTPNYVGPNSDMPFAGNNLACTNCHLDGGTRPNAVPVYVASYEYAEPGQFSSRSNSYLTIEDRINGCMQRSMDGSPMPEDGYEVQSMKAYFEWLATGKAEGIDWTEVKGQEYPKLAYLDRAADPIRGKVVFEAECSTCHGVNGEGEWDESKGNYKFPQLFGNDTYNNGAGMNRILPAAAFIHANMPYGDPKSLTVENAYDVAAYINSQARPEKENLHLDWSGIGPDGSENITKKRVDAPYGPYYPGDMFPEEQFKYGPWQPIIDARNALKQDKWHNLKLMASLV